MLISAFAQRAGLSPDTVRFYVRRGLLAPTTGRKGGSNPYQTFSERDVQEARLIRLAQSLGFTLRDIGGLAAELRSTGLSRKRRIAILAERLAALEQKAGEIARMATYLRAKIGWMEAGERGAEPRLDADAPSFAAVERVAPPASTPRRSRVTA